TRYWYLSHHVGLFGLLVWANAAGMTSVRAGERESFRMGESSFQVCHEQSLSRHGRNHISLMTGWLRVCCANEVGQTMRTNAAPDPPVDQKESQFLVPFVEQASLPGASG